MLILLSCLTLCPFIPMKVYCYSRVSEHCVLLTFVYLQFIELLSRLYLSRVFHWFIYMFTVFARCGWRKFNTSPPSTNTLHVYKWWYSTCVHTLLCPSSIGGYPVTSQVSIKTSVDTYMSAPRRSRVSSWLTLNITIRTSSGITNLKNTQIQQA